MIKCRFSQYKNLDQINITFNNRSKRFSKQKSSPNCRTYDIFTIQCLQPLITLKRIYNNVDSIDSPLGFPPIPRLRGCLTTPRGATPARAWPRSAYVARAIFELTRTTLTTRAVCLLASHLVLVPASFTLGSRE